MSFTLLVLALFAYSAAFVPPKRLGHSRGSPTAPVELDMFIDWQCSNSLYSWGTITKVLQNLGDKVYFNLYVSHIWHFRQSADVAIAVQIITQTNKIGRDDPKYWPIAQFMFDHQSEFWNAQNYETTEKDFVQKLANYASTHFGVSNATFYADYTKGESGNGQMAASQEIRYTYTSGVSSTPTFRINGMIDDSVGSLTTYDEWVTYLNKFINNKEMGL